MGTLETKLYGNRTWPYGQVPYVFGYAASGFEL